MKLISSGRRNGRTAIRVATAAVIAALGLTACSEKLDSTGGCPTVCGGVTADVQNETFDAAVVLDTSVAGVPTLGTEPMMLLASRGDTLDTRIILRFDTLPVTRRTSLSDSTQVPITFIDSAFVRIRFDSGGGQILHPVTLSVYDIDAPGDDTAVAVLAPLFVPGRRVGFSTFAAGRVIDTVRIPLDSAYVRQKIQTAGRIRLGIQATSASTSVTLRAFSTATSSDPFLSFAVSPDTALAQVVVRAASRTPTNNPIAASSLRDFTLVVEGTPPPAPGFLAVGGIPALRSYFRLDIPSRIVDSSIVIRATLLLTQLGNGGADSADTMRIQPYLVVAGAAITDPTRASQILAPTSFPLGSVVSRPQETGVREIELAPAFRVWQVQSPTDLPRAITIGATLEGLSPQQLLFYDTNAALPLRPKLRVSYIPRSRIGTP